MHTLTLSDAIAALNAACDTLEVDGYDGEAVAYLTALLTLNDDPAIEPIDAVRRAYGLPDA